MVSEFNHITPTAMQLADELRKLRDFCERSGPACEGVLHTLIAGTAMLADRVAALESREEYRHRIKPIMQGERPERGVGGT